MFATEMEPNNHYQNALIKAQEKSPEDLEKAIKSLKRKIAEREAESDIKHAATSKLTTEYYAMLDVLRG